MNDKRDLMSMTLQELAAFMAELKEPAFRAKQLFKWLHEKGANSIDAMSDLSKALREKLKETAYVTNLAVERDLRSADGTRKFLFALADGNFVETVAMQYEHGLSVCVSSQVGCRMGCAFCASTKAGYVRSLAPSEMLAQVYEAGRLTGCRVDSIVLMGIGEPLDNFDNVMRFIDLLTDKAGYGLANRGVALSTCGVVPGIDALAQRKLQLTLSVSLHAATDEKRSAMMPINRKYPIAQLLAACSRYFEATGRRISFEYAVIHGENDTDADADALARLLGRMNAHVNLIPVNPIREANFTATRANAKTFQDKLIARGLNATVRRTLGTDISAACGQLRRDAQQSREGGVL